jgi:translation initiation factor 1A
VLRWREAISPYPGENEEEGGCKNPRLDCSRVDGFTLLSQVWINQGDIILLSLRDFQDDKADVIVKYTADEARSCKSSLFFLICTLPITVIQVKAYGELPENAKINETDTFGDEEGEFGFEFADGGDELDIDDI